MNEYQLTTNPALVTRTSDGATIPVGANNMESNAYDAWIAEGNTPDPAPDPVVVTPPVPTLADLQARLTDLQAQLTVIVAQPKTGS